MVHHHPAQNATMMLILEPMHWQLALKALLELRCRQLPGKRSLRALPSPVGYGAPCKRIDAKHGWQHAQMADSQARTYLLVLLAPEQISPLCCRRRRVGFTVNLQQQHDWM